MSKIIMKHIKLFILVAILILICNFLSVLYPYVVREVLNVDFSAENISEILIRLFAIYLTIHVVLALMKNLRNIKSNQLMAEILSDIREKLFIKVLKLKMKTFNKYNSSEIYTRLTVDSDNLFDLFYGILQILVNNIVYIVLMVIMMFVANVNLAIIGCLTIIIVAISSLTFTRKLKKIQDVTYDKRDAENKEYSEMYNKSKLTYLFGLQKNNIKKIHKLLDEELKNRKKYIFVNHFMPPVATILESFGIYAILYYALNINLNISLGDIYLVLFYVKQCKTPLNELFDQLEEMQLGIASLSRINTLLKEKDEEDLNSGYDAKDLNGDIEFKNVCMKYGKETVLKNVSFVIKKGSKVTIAGRTGAGKTTLTNVFMRLYDIQSGKILIGGHDIYDVSIKSLRDNISYISQNPYILEDTLRNNITLGNENISDEQIFKIIEEMNVGNIFERFPNGLDQKIKEQKLSYGELQVISFIRAIAHKANIYIFDEPTSNIDLKTEKLIQNLIDKISKQNTVIIVAHRKSTIESSDKIIYMKDGKVDVIINKAFIDN